MEISVNNNCHLPFIARMLSDSDTGKFVADKLQTITSYCLGHIYVNKTHHSAWHLEEEVK